jgi:lipid II:glycine glycyltransferase (peptidoglycan interpeptide bridge formation enzyme)
MYFSLSPNNLLLYEVIQFAKEKGCKIFNLGGGYEQNDSLFRFKSSFSSSFTDFFTFTKIHDSRIYKILCQTRDRFDYLNNNEIKRTGYFPEYRR